MALVRAKGKVNAFLPLLAFVFLLWICEVRAPRLAAHDLFAPSKPVIPLTSDPSIDLAGYANAHLQTVGGRTARQS